MKKDKILITGGAGYVGGSLTDYLISLDYSVFILDNHSIQKRGAITYKVDLTNSKKLNKLIKKINPSIVIHLAALTISERSQEYIQSTFKVNAEGTLNLLNASRNIPYRLFLNFSTFDVYFENKPKFNEIMKVNPNSPYCASKIVTETYCELFNKLYNKNIITLRMPLLYGPGQEGTFFSYLIKNSIKGTDINMTPGKQKREFVYISDFNKAILKLIKLNKKQPGVYNLGTGKPYSLIDITKKVIKLTNSNSKININKNYKLCEIFEYKSNISKLYKLIKWRPQVDIIEGIKNIIKETK